MWTRFMDMHSGGDLKEQWQYIYIEASFDEAIVIFYNRFGHNPNRVTCTCCGEDYSVGAEEDLAQLTGYDRNCHWNNVATVYEESPRIDWPQYCEIYKDEHGRSKHLTLQEYESLDSVLFIRVEDIKPEDRLGDVPEQGYVWLG